MFATNSIRWAVNDPRKSAENRRKESGIGSESSCRIRSLPQRLERAAPPQIGEPMSMLDGADVEGGDPTSTHEELPVARDAPPVAPNTPLAPPGAPRTMIDAP